MRKHCILLFYFISVNLAFCQTSKVTDTCFDKQNLYIYVVVDELPTFTFGKMNLMEFIYKNLKWPNEFDGQGSVIVSFVINKDGNVCNIKIEKSLFPECDKEALRVLSSMPKWNPGKINNKPVDVIFYLPINFRIGQ